MIGVGNLVSFEGPIQGLHKKWVARIKEVKADGRFVVTPILGATRADWQAATPVSFADIIHLQVMNTRGFAL